MSQIERILQRQPRIDEAVVEDVRARAVARLLTFSLPREDPAEEDPAAEEVAAEEAADRSDAAFDGGPGIQVVDHAEPITLPLDGPWAAAEDDGDQVPTNHTIIALGAPVHDDAPAITPIVVLQPRVAAAPSPTPQARPATPRPARRTPRSRVLATAYCPYCALPLDPPPTEDGRCTRCRHLIVVREGDGGMLVYLTEAALKVFDAERERAANIERWTVERRTWLDLARWVGASPQRIERLQRPVASLESVRAARSFYDATVDSAVEGALRQDLWDVAAVYRREQADSLRTVAGPDRPPSDEFRDLYRAAATIELRGIASMARTATIVGARCCDTCRAANGTVHRVAAELRSSTLPHASCPTGLCRCRWDLTPHDVRMVQRYLERTRGLPAGAKAELRAGNPTGDGTVTPG